MCFTRKQHNLNSPRFFECEMVQTTTNSQFSTHEKEFQLNFDELLLLEHVFCSIKKDAKHVSQRTPLKLSK